MSDATETTLAVVDITSEIQSLKTEIESLARNIVEKYIRIGELLTIAYTQLQHGEHLNWLKNDVKMSQSQASRCMRLAANKDNPKLVSATNLTEALAILAAPKADKLSDDESKSHTIVFHAVSKTWGIKEITEEQRAKLEAEKSDLVFLCKSDAEIEASKRNAKFNYTDVEVESTIVEQSSYALAVTPRTDPNTGDVIEADRDLIDPHFESQESSKLSTEQVVKQFRASISTLDVASLQEIRDEIERAINAAQQSNEQQSLSAAVSATQDLLKIDDACVEITAPEAPKWQATAATSAIDEATKARHRAQLAKQLNPVNKRAGWGS